MKLQRISMLGCMVATMALIASCSGEDGAVGPVGPAGPTGQVGPTGPTGDAGADSADGADGINCWDLNGDGVNDPEEDINGDEVFDALDCQGEDGEGGQGTTAERIIVDTSDITGGENPVELNVPEMTQEVLDTHVVLAYLSDGTDYYSIPGRVNLLTEHEFSTFITEGILRIREYTGQGWNTIFTEVHIILIPTTTAEPSAPTISKSPAEVKASLKSIGVDASDYKEVVRYFGLDQ
ncbi:collagen-like triple helix repeat-containing protein [Flagellimonas marina]|uniref:Collagen-like protein n=1 Tax=Flagellimonas marina TaxID=1775168 RepID=A0ABV8PIR5_9FLAO